MNEIPYPDTLTAAQGSVYAHLVQGFTVKESAEALGVIPKTIENRRCAVMKRLDIHTTARVIVWHYTEFVPFVNGSAVGGAA